MDGTDDDTAYYSSGLNPTSYEPYCREMYVETLNDWGGLAPGRHRVGSTEVSAAMEVGEDG
jgi:hypothetical protein